jgi:hypothetical protein
MVQAFLKKWWIESDFKTVSAEKIISDGFSYSENV